MGIQVVWLKRDLRARDHVPLAQAAMRGPVCVLYVYEPHLWALPEHDASHLAFVEACLDELDEDLRPLGGRLTRRTGRLVEVLQDLNSRWQEHGGIEALWSHQETGLLWTYARDRAVKRWADASGVAWHEHGQDGVCRPHPSRDGWASRWTRAMARPIAQAPDRIVDVAELVPDHDHGRAASAPELDLGPSSADPTQVQPAGSAAAIALLQDFLGGRARDYRSRLSSPITGWSACSRLSTHLAWGTISTRTVWQHTRLSIRRHQGLTRRDPAAKRFVEDLEAFEGRLRWRGHFMQKLEDEPRLERENLHPALDGVREPGFDARKLQAWIDGRTGWPMVDACMRSLHTRKWLNFRMRAMLASIASYPLWLHWREPARALAPHFLDFEPGIHFSQFQMQAGTTGINRLRIYDPTKQARDHDPHGDFIRRWVPELRDVPDTFIHEPHRMDGPTQTRAGCRIGRDYPAPIVDHRRASALARRKVERALSTAEARDRSQAIHQRHGSRMPAMRRRWR